ncbi:MAG: glucose 1-dehydrogenase [Lachnospiraceae bacterium]|nr:glucose 1-dehydrogenase [Lachnospiraceae bacterium]
MTVKSCGRVQNKKALITGSSTGLGREIALELAREGAEVTLHYARGHQGAKSAAEEINRAGGKAHVVQGDLRKTEDAQRIVREAAAAMGGIDILVNNAGLTDTMRFLEVKPEDFDNLFNLNIRGMFFCAQEAVRYMQKNGNGSIINMSSMHGIASLPGYSIYAPTKGAIIALTKQLSVELAADAIRVNCIAPGCIIVPSDYEKNPDLDVQEIAEAIPMKAVGNPLDVAKLAVFLASDDAKYITGDVTVIDGGILAKAAFATPEAVE